MRINPKTKKVEYPIRDLEKKRKYPSSKLK